MGANFQTMTLPGTTSRDEVTKTFSKVQDRDRSQNDSQHAGGFGMCSGLILTDYNFHIRRTAEAYLMGRSQKWDHALAVKYDTGEGQNWLIGAWCEGNCSRPHSGRSWNWAGVGVAEKV